MATVDYRTPTQKEMEILERNGIKPEGLAVKRSDKDTIHLLRHNTRDEIIIHRGDKQW